MKRRISTICAALAGIATVEAFVQPQRTTAVAPSRQSAPATSLNLWLPDDHALTSASSFLSTIDSDIASIPDDEFRKVFAGGGAIMLGSILSTVFVGFMIESTGAYADLVAETYAEQDLDEGKESFLDSLGLDAGQKAETEEMVRAFREKKMRKAGTWTEKDEEDKQQLTEAKTEEKVDMFSDY